MTPFTDHSNVPARLHHAGNKVGFVLREKFGVDLLRSGYDAAHSFGTRRFTNWNGLAGQAALIAGALSGDDAEIDRNLLSGRDADHHAGHQLVHVAFQRF